MATTQITLRTAVVLPFVMIFIITLGVIVAVQKSSYEDMVVNVSDQALSSLTDNVTLELNHFLSPAFDASLAISHTIGFGELYRHDDMRQIEAYLRSSFSDLYRSIPNLDAIGFGGEGAEYVGYRREANQGLTLMLKDRRTLDKLVIYRGQQVSGEVRSVIDNYDPRVRPWYTPIADHHHGAWSSIYANADERQDITLTALTPVFAEEKFVGVVGADLKIDTFNAFLRQQRDKNSVIIYITDAEQRLVAHSTEGSVVSWGTAQSKKGDRLLAIESGHPVVKASALHASEANLFQQGRFEQQQYYRFPLSLNGQRYFNHITPYTDSHGLTWYIGVAIAEQDLLGDLAQSQRNGWLTGLLVSVLGVLVCLIALNKVVKPITSTADAAKHLAKGDWDSHMPKPGHIYETNLLVFAFNEMANNLKASFKALKSQLLYDSLTRLYSREGLVDTCDSLRKLEGTLLLVGINKFRDINDSLGHLQGDQLLAIIAERLKTRFEQNSYLARIGGDEFAIYIPAHRDNEPANVYANQVLQMFASPFSMASENVVVNVSVGIVEEGPSHNMTLWLRNGSIALSNAKQEPSNISYYKPEMADISRKRTLMQAKIQSGVEKQEFLPFYQPIVDLASGKVVGAEALARWQSADSGLISPMEFIPIAEESGLIGAIGETILRQACNDTVKGMQDGKWDEDFHIHVNLSVKQLSNVDLIASLKRILDESGLDADNLTLEITESRIVDNDPVIIKNMRAIRDLGVHIAIDDFGTGYSSLAYLHKLPFDCLKIDRTFVNKMRPEQLDTSIVAAIVNMTKSMKVELVAEGIETQEQAQMLTSLACPLGQGFLYSRPITYQDWPTDLVNMKR